MNPIVEAIDVDKVFGDGEGATRAVDGVTCYVNAGELVLLVGPSGSGKTTLVSMLAGLMRPSSGELRLGGISTSQMPEHLLAPLRRKTLGFVFQTYNLFPALSALDNVAEILVLRGTPREDARTRATEVLTRVGLAARLHHRPGQLSGGQKQRVAIARAIAGSPPLIIGDEITAALDSGSARAVIEMLRAYVGEQAAVLLVTHDHRLEPYADRILAMEDGRLRSHAHAGGAAPGIPGDPC